MSHTHRWDDHAGDYGRMADHFEPEYGKATTLMLDIVDVQPGMRVLDLASGPGHVSGAASARGARTLGIDSSAVMVAEARRRFPDLDFDVGDMHDPPKGPWDAILCRMGAHHADPSWLSAAVKVLRRGGRLAIAELGDDTEKDRGNGMRGAQHWVDLFTTAGLRDVVAQELDVALGDRAESLPPEQQVRFKGHHRNRSMYVIAGAKQA